jgi:hypothetical protein
MFKFLKDLFCATPLTVGAVLKFDYPQGGGGNRFVKVLNMRDTKKNPILPSSRWANPNIERGRWLVTGMDVYGTPRCYYLELCDVVYVAGPIYRVGYHALRVYHKWVG